MGITCCIILAIGLLYLFLYSSQDALLLDRSPYAAGLYKR